MAKKTILDECNKKIIESKKRELDLNTRLADEESRYKKIMASYEASYAESVANMESQLKEQQQQTVLVNARMEDIRAMFGQICK